MFRLLWLDLHMHVLGCGHTTERWHSPMPILTWHILLVFGGDFDGHGLSCFQRKINQVLRSGWAERKCALKACRECRSPNEWLGAFTWRMRLTLLWSKMANCVQWAPALTSLINGFIPITHTLPKQTIQKRGKWTEVPFLTLSLLSLSYGLTNTWRAVWGTGQWCSSGAASMI